MGHFSNPKVAKTSACLWKCFFMIEKDPFSVCNDRYDSGVFG